MLAMFKVLLNVLTCNLFARWSALLLAAIFFHTENSFQYNKMGGFLFLLISQINGFLDAEDIYRHVI